jgi:hypothetical protein
MAEKNRAAPSRPRRPADKPAPAPSRAPATVSDVAPEVDSETRIQAALDLIKKAMGFKELAYGAIEEAVEVLKGKAPAVSTEAAPTRRGPTPVPNPEDEEDDLGGAREGEDFEGEDDDLLDDDDELGGDLDDEEDFADDDEDDEAEATADDPEEDDEDEEEADEEDLGDDVPKAADCQVGDRLEMIDPKSKKQFIATVVKANRRLVSLRASIKAYSGDYDDAKLADFGTQLMLDEEDTEA